MDAAAAHRRACAWFGSSGLLPEAVGHAPAAGDIEDATARMESVVSMMLAEYEFHRAMEDWLSALSDAQVRARPMLGTGFVEHGVAERCAHAVEHARGQQEALEVGGLPVQHLGAEIVRDQPVAARERRHEPCDVGSGAHRQPRELQSGGPSFGADHERRDLGARQGQAHALDEEVEGLVDGEAEIRGAQLRQLAAPPQARHRQRRVLPVEITRWVAGGR